MANGSQKKDSKTLLEVLPFHIFMQRQHQNYAYVEQSLTSMLMALESSWDVWLSFVATLTNEINCTKFFHQWNDYFMIVWYDTTNIKTENFHWRIDPLQVFGLHPIIKQILSINYSDRLKEASVE